MDDIQDDIANNRVTNVNVIAKRIAKAIEGCSIRESIYALAMVSGALIRQCFDGQGIFVTINEFGDILVKMALEKKR